LKALAGSRRAGCCADQSNHLAGYVDQAACRLTAQVEPYRDKMNAYKWVDAEKDGKYYAMPWDSGQW
jgi:hypothetical protein